MRKKLVTGLFKTRARACAAADTITKMGVTDNDIAMICPKATRNKKLGFKGASRAAAGAGMGGAIGGSICALLAALAAGGTHLIFPGYDIAVAGPFAAALAAAGAGGFTGGLIGMLIGYNVTAYRTEVYDTDERAASALLGVEVQTREQAKNLSVVLKDLGAEQVKYG